MATPDGHDESACGTRMATFLRGLRVKVRSGNVEEPTDHLLLRAPFPLARHDS